MRADGARNTLTLSGTAQDIGTLLDAIRMFDIDTMKGMSFALVPVRSGDADLLAEDLKNVFGSEREGPMGGMIRFLGNKRLSSILVISSQSEYISRARAWIEKLDARAEHSDKQFFTYRVQNRPAKEVATVLTSIFGAKGQTDSSVSPRFGQSSLSSGGLGGGGGGGGGPARRAFRVRPDRRRPQAAAASHLLRPATAPATAASRAAASVRDSAAPRALPAASAGSACRVDRATARRVRRRRSVLTTIAIRSASTTPRTR